MTQTIEVLTLEQMPKAMCHLLRELAEVKSILNVLKDEKTGEADHWMDVEELIQYLPGNPKRQTIYCWVNDGKIPHHKASANRLAFRKSEIDKWLGIDKVIYDGDLDDEESDILLPVKACGDVINRRGGYK